MNIDTPAKKIGKESTISFVGLGYGHFVRYLFTAILARLVGVHFLGIYSLGTSITNISTVISKAGTDVGIMRYISMRDVDKDRKSINKDILSTLKMGLLFSIMMMIVQILLAGWLIDNIFKESDLLKTVLIVFAISIPFTTLMTIMTFATQGFQLLKYKIFVDQILNPTILILSMLLFYFTFSSEMAIIVPTLLVGIIGFIVANYFLNNITGISVTNIGKAKFNKSMFYFSLPIMFTTIVGSLMHWMDILMLGFFTNSEIVGLYHPAARTAGLQQSVLIAFVGIFGPMFSRYYAKQDFSGMNHIFVLVTRWIFTLIIPFLILIVLFSSKIMLLFGSDFLASANALVLLSIGTSVFAIFGITARALVVSGYQNWNLINAIVVIFLNIILNVILIPRFGIMGAAIATLSSMVLLSIIRIIETKMFLKIIPFNKTMLKPLIAGTITYTVVWFIKPQIMGYHTIVTLILAGLLILLLYFIILIILKLDDDDKDFLRSINFLKNKVINPNSRN